MIFARKPDAVVLECLFGLVLKTSNVYRVFTYESERVYYANSERY